MPRETTAKFYKERINKVLHYIQTHLNEDLDLSKLAEISAISPFHFHRIMRAYLNESLMSYIIRVRLETSVTLLVHSQLSIREIAWKTGYDVPSSFNKAFKKRFGVSPGEFRNGYDGNSTIDYYKTDKKMKTATALKCEIINMNPQKVIYVTSIGPYDGKGTEEAWRKVCGIAGQKGLFGQDTKFIGISHDDPHITDPDKLRYDACLTVAKEVNPEGELGVKEVSGGKYAVFMHEGSYMKFQESYNYIFSVWLPDSGEELREDMCFEMYLNSPDDTKTEDLRTEIYVPLK